MQAATLAAGSESVAPVDHYPAAPHLDDYDDGAISHGLVYRTAAQTGRLCGRLVLPAMTAYAGLNFILSGAHSEAEIGGMRVEAVTDVGFGQEGLTASVELQDEEYQDTRLGSISFPDFLPLPISVNIHAYPQASTVEAALQGRYTYVLNLQQGAQQEAAALQKHITNKALIGLGGGAFAGALANELAAAAWRRRHDRHDTHARSRHPVCTGAGYSAVALTLLAGGGVVAAQNIEPDMSHYEASGLIGMALSNPDRFSDIDLQNEVLNNIFADFQEKHACPDTEVLAPHGASSLTITTYNIKRGLYGIEAVADELLATQSDVILLQEVTPETIAVLAGRLGMQAIEGWTITDDTDTFGNAILTNLPIQSSEMFELPSEDVEQRGLLTARLLSPSGEPLVVASTHLTNEYTGIRGDRNEQLRIEQAAAVVEILQHIAREDEAVIVGGDMNQGTDSKTYDQLTNDFTDTLSPDTDLAGSASFPSNGQRFDIILTNTDWETIQAQRGGSGASDHCLESATLAPTGRYRGSVYAVGTTPATATRGDN